MGKIGKRIIAIVMPIIMVAIVSLCLCLPLGGKDKTENSNKGNNTPIYFASAEETGASTASSSEKGGAIYVGVNANYTMKGGTIEGKTNTYGGAVFISSGATFTMEGGTITGCQAKYGGAIYVASGGTCNIYGGSITGNKAEHAPAIYVEDGGTLNIQNDAVIENNEYSPYIFVSSDTIQVGGTYEGTASTLYLHYIEFGSYPQTYVGDSMNETLETWYNSSSPANLKTYTTRVDGNYGSYTSHMYTDGEIYARGYSNKHYYSSSYTYSTRDSVPANGTVVWFKVEPIRWLVLNYDEYIAGTDTELELLSELVLTGNIYFNTTSDGNSWETSFIREWMNGTFYNSAFTVDEQEMIATSTVLNNVTGDYENSTSDGSGPTTYDKIYLKSYNEMSSGLFSTGKTNQNHARIMCSPTDFALSNNTYMNTSWTTSYRKGTSYYWTRSAGSTASDACLVLYNGVIRSHSVNIAYGVRPALKVTI